MKKNINGTDWDSSKKGIDELSSVIKFGKTGV